MQEKGNLIVNDKLFHSLGPATEKCTIMVLKSVCGMDSSDSSADLKDMKGEVRGQHFSKMIWFQSMKWLRNQ